MIYDQNRFRNRTPSPLKNVHFLAKSSTVIASSRATRARPDDSTKKMYVLILYGVECEVWFPVFWTVWLRGVGVVRAVGHGNS
jgi:hypothetical protein